MKKLFFYQIKHDTKDRPRFIFDCIKMPCFHLHLQQSAPRSTSGQTPRWHRWRFLWSVAASCGVWCEACSLWFCRSGPGNARFWLEVHLVTRRWKNYWSDAPSFYAHHHLHWLKKFLILKWAFLIVLIFSSSNVFWWQITNVLWTISQKAGLNLIYNIKWKINQIKHITQPIIKTSSNTETAYT